MCKGQKITVGNVEINCFNTSDTIEVFTYYEEINDLGDAILETQRVLFDYKTFSNLKEAINKIDLP